MFGGGWSVPNPICGGGVVSQYFPLSGFIDYSVTDITGQWHPDTLHLDVTTRTPNIVKPYQRITAIPSGAMTARTFGLGGVPCSHITPGYALYAAQGPDGIGEVVNQADMVQWPPILLLPTTPVTGAVINGSSTVYAPTPEGNRSSFDFPWRHRVLHVGQPWGPWTDTVRCGLWEQPANPGTNVYQYVFARGIGMVHFWYGPLSGNAVAGWEFYAVGWG